MTNPDIYSNVKMDEDAHNNWVENICFSGRKGEGSPEKYFEKLKNCVDIPEKLLIIRDCMDTQNDKRNGERQMLAELSRRKVVVGSKQLRKALDKGSVRFVVLARNADPAITEPIEAICRRDDVPVTWVSDKLTLGKACGIEVGAAAAAAVE